MAVGAMFGLIATGATVHTEGAGYAAGLVVLWVIFGIAVALVFLLVADLHHRRNGRRQQRAPVHLSVCHPLFALGARTQHVDVHELNRSREFSPREPTKSTA